MSESAGHLLASARRLRRTQVFAVTRTGAGARKSWLTGRAAIAFTLCFWSFAFCVLSAVLGSCSKETGSSGHAPTLLIISPHGTDIRREFAEAFSAWHQKHFGQPVEIQWPDVGGGGTQNIVRELNGRYAASSSAPYDLAWGGGSATFTTFAANHFLVPPPPLDPAEAKQAGWASDPIDDVPPDILGTPLHEKNRAWVGAAMSAFGMVINKDRIAELHLKTPVVWEDLAFPDYFGLLSLADPSKSGSVKTSYEMIFQQYGWEKGWAVLTELFANTAMIREGGANPADDVASADAVAGIVIDFYARLQILRAGQSIAGFVIPQGGTSLDPDPIALLKGAPHQDLAARFMRFVVSPEGQRLWTFRAGTPGGPRKSTLGRLCVLPSLYEHESQYMFDPANPFVQTPGGSLHFDPSKQQSRNVYLGDLIKAALVDNRAALVRTRKAIKQAGDPPELLAKLTAPPSFQMAHLAPPGTGDPLEYDTPRPMHEADLATVAREFAPPKDDPKATYSERLQNNLRDHWRSSFAARFAELQKVPSAH